MSKRYRLLQDYISPVGKCCEGVVNTTDEWRSYWFPGLSDEDFTLRDDWFEEVKEERIEVDLLGLDIPIPKCLNSLYSSHPIPKEKFPAIKEAIEQILNGEYVVNADNTWSLIGKYTFSVNPPETAAEKTELPFVWTNKLVEEYTLFRSRFYTPDFGQSIEAFKKYKMGQEFLWSEPQIIKEEKTDKEQPLYTQSELDKAVEDAFGAARKVEYWGSFPCHTHPKFSDYKAYLNTQKTKQ